MAVHQPSFSDPLILIKQPAPIQAYPRHTEIFTYRCFLPDLTGFVSLNCAGPKHQHRLLNQP